MSSKLWVIAATSALAAVILAIYLWPEDSNDRKKAGSSDNRPGERASVTRRARAVDRPLAPRSLAVPDETPWSTTAEKTAASNLAALVNTDAGECLVGSITRCQALEADFDACSRGDARACLRAAQEIGDTAPRDMRLSRLLLTRACKAGASEACERLENEERLREALDSDPDAQQRAWAQCELGDASQCHALLEKRRGDEHEAERQRLLRRMCELGFDREGCMSLALHADSDEGRWALEHACTLDSPDACQLYARHLLGHGPGADGEIDFEAAKRAYAHACELAPEHQACDEWAQVLEEGGWPEDLD